MDDNATAYHSSSRANTSATCKTMEDVRYEVDRLDRLLVKIIAERVTYMDAAARIKNSREKVYDAARIEDVVTKVLDAAKTAELPAEIAEPVWRLLIDRCIAHEYDSWDRTKGDDK